MNDEWRIRGVDLEIVIGINKIMPAHVCVISEEGLPIYDKYIAPTEKVTNYCTITSKERRMEYHRAGIGLRKVRNQLKKLIEERILVGCNIGFFLTMLEISHPPEDIKDVSLCIPYLAANGFQRPSLGQISMRVFEKDFTLGEYDCFNNAKLALDLYHVAPSEMQYMLSQAWNIDITLPKSIVLFLHNYNSIF